MQLNPKQESHKSLPTMCVAVLWIFSNGTTTVCYWITFNATIPTILKCNTLFNSISHINEKNLITRKRTRSGKVTRQYDFPRTGKNSCKIKLTGYISIFSALWTLVQHRRRVTASAYSGLLWAMGDTNIRDKIRHKFSTNHIFMINSHRTKKKITHENKKRRTEQRRLERGWTGMFTKESTNWDG